MRVCGSCKETKPFEEFYRKGPAGYHSRCKVCHKNYSTRYMRKRRQETPGYGASWRRETLLKSKFGITCEDYEELLEAQGGVCRICGRKCSTGRRLAVDHDHNTGIVRGLLCLHCNVAIGYLEDDPERLRRAAEYLEDSLLKNLPSLKGE